MLSKKLNFDYYQLKFCLLIALWFLGGCGSIDAPSEKVPSVYIPEAPSWSETPSAEPLPIDGEWKNDGGAIFQIKNGKGRALNSPSLDPHSVVFKDIQKVGPGKYTLNQLTFNSKSRKSYFGTGYLELISRTEILLRLFPNPVTHSSGTKVILTNVRLDNELLYLDEIDNAGLQESWYLSESNPEYSILFLTENQNKIFSKKKTVFDDPKNISINFHNKPCIEKETDWLVTIFAKDRPGKEVFGFSYGLQSINTQFEYPDNGCISKTMIQSTKLHTMKPGEYIAVLKVGKTLKNAVDFTVLPH